MSQYLLINEYDEPLWVEHLNEQLKLFETGDTTKLDNDIVEVECTCNCHD